MSSFFSRGSLQPRSTRPLRPQTPPPLSIYSSGPVTNKGWGSENFMLGAGMVIIQPSTNKVVVIYDTEYRSWLLPSGRKDIGESLETTALREAYEESGYRVEFLPLHNPCHAPSPPNDPDARWNLNTEPVFISLKSWAPNDGNRPMGGQYLMCWYVGQIPQDAVHTQGTGMPDEQSYTSHLLTYEGAMNVLSGNHRNALRYAWAVYRHTIRIEQEILKRDAKDARPPANPTNPPKATATN